jgi:hypothetical protein
VLPAARRLVDHRLASPSFIQVHGIPTSQGLLPRPDSPGCLVNRGSMATRPERRPHLPAAP